GAGAAPRSGHIGMTVVPVAPRRIGRASSAPPPRQGLASRGRARYVSSQASTFLGRQTMVTTDQGQALHPAQQQVRGLPAWYFVLAGLLVASFDVSEQFRTNHPLIAV